MNEEITEAYFKCSCTSEVMHLIKYKDEDEVYLSIYALQYNHSFIHRLKQCWKILTTGSPYGDQVVLDQNEQLKLSKWLKDI